MNHAHYIMNHAHYIPEDLEPHILDGIKICILEGPEFIGQGISKRVGSDSYGYYIVAKKQVKAKVIFGIIEACTKFGLNGWTDGHQECSLPNKPEACTPTKWIIQSGWNRDKKTKEKTSPKWYFCDADGHKFNGQHANFSWNGCYAYQNPSF